MVILDNHISSPGWCCSSTDGNGFFGDEYFDPDLWIEGLTTMASLFKETNNVIGMSLRNELRGPNQNVNAWYKYMQRGAEAVHTANQNVLVILSGLQFDNDLSFLNQQQVKLSFTGKLVFEVHRYAFSIGQGWRDGVPDDVCANFITTFMSNAGFLLEQGFPLFLSEFGGDQRGTDVNDNRFLSCFYALIADLDLDWALWTYQGSYYLRVKEIDSDEKYGILNHNWDELRNATLMQRVYAIQPPLQGPGLPSVAPYKMIFHPSTGFCVHNHFIFQQLKLGLCRKSNAWTYSSSEKTIELAGTGAKFCLSAVGIGKRVKVGVDCSSDSSKWEMISKSKLQLSTSLSSGERVCMDHSNDSIITSPCKCLEGDTKCEPATQWFKIINSTMV